MADTTIGTSVAIATPDLEVIEGHVTTTSNQVAAHFGKRHADVIRAIQKLSGEIEADWYQRNFAFIQKTTELGNGRTRKDPAYRITRDGFTLLAMGFTGKEAMQWKVAYLTAFNKMEQELLARTTRPHNPALDYDRFSPAQKQDLKEIVNAIVQAGVQKYGETWARLQSKFRVNKYEELPASQYEEARRYLIAKLPGGYKGAVTEEATTQALPNMDRTRAAFDAASQAAASVQTAVFNAVLSGNDEWKYSRWMLAFIDDSAKGSPAYVRQLEHGAFITTWPRLVRDVGTGECMCTSAELLDMAAACMQRLQQRGGPARLAA